MSVWEDESRREVPLGTPAAEPVRQSTVVHGRPRTQSDMRAAAERDAAEIVARARREIRRIVIEARHELVELQAQVEAASAAVASAAVAREAAAHEALAREATARETAAREAAEREALHRHSDTPPAPSFSAGYAPVREPAAGSSIWADARADDGVTRSSSTFVDEDFRVADPVPLSSSAPGSARTFVALFTVAGLIVVGGTFWWVTRRPAASPSAQTEPATSGLSPDEAAAIAAANPLAPPPEEPKVVPASLALSLEAVRPTWVRVIVDGEPDAGHTYAAGETRQIAGAGEVSIRAGDAGSLLVSVDGGAAAPLGPDGVTLTRRFLRPATTPSPASDAMPAAAAAPSREALVEPLRTPPPVEPPPRPTPTPMPSPTAGPPGPSAPAVAAAPIPPPPAPVIPIPTPRPPATSIVPATPPAAAAAPRAASPARFDVAASGRQWLDAYHRQDRVSIEALAAPSLTVNDERRPTERFPFGLEVSRAFEDEQLQLAGDTAQFTARMIERASTGAFVSRVTQTWIRRSGEWQLQEARIAHEDLAPTGR